MDAALSEPRELSGKKNYTSSDGRTCSNAPRPEVNSLLTKIADTLSTIQQPLPSAPAPLPPLPPFDPSALLNTLTSQGASIDSLLDSLTRGVHGSSPLLSSMTAPLPSSTSLPLSSLTSLSHTQSAGQSVGQSVLMPDSLVPGSSPPNNVTSADAMALPVLPDPIFPHDGFSRPPPPAPRGALAINGVPAVTATVVARSVSPAAPPLPLPPPPGALVASALPPVPTPSSQNSQHSSSSTAPPAFTATPLTTSHFPLSTSVPFSGPGLAPPTSSMTTPLGNHVLTAELFFSGPLPPSSTNELTTQGAAPTTSQSPDHTPMLQTLTSELHLTPTPNNVETLVNELTRQGLPPEMSSVHTQMSSGEIASSVVQTTPQEAPPSSEAGFNEPISQGLPPPAEQTRPSPPSLHANEELLSDDSDEGAMEVAPQSGGSLAPPTVPANAAAGSRSDSASPYTDDASFASFVAGEAHDSGSPMDDEHFSPSPSPLPSMAQSIDALVSQMTSHPAPSSSRLAMQAQFGVTAYCPRSPILPPPSASTAPLDMTAQNFPKRSKYAHRAAMSAMHPYQRTRGGGVNVAKTLDLLKAVLQSSFNMEVKRLCDDYLQLYSQAAANIKENTGDTVPEATLRLLVNKMLEEAQHGYQKGEWEFPSSKLPRNDKVAPAKASPMANKKVKVEKGETRYGPPKRSRRAPADHQQTGSEKTSWKWSMDKKRVDPGKWKPDTLSPDTYFVLGVNVNKALGHGANRGKVYYLHPELFKYACDGDDKTWLYENKLLPVHGGKAFLMILKEVKFLVGSEECYRNNKEILNAVVKLQEFQVPQFMLDKMKTFMRSVQGYFAQEASSASSSAQTVSNSQDSSTSDAATQNS